MIIYSTMSAGYHPPFWSGYVVWDVAASLIPIIRSHPLALEPLWHLKVVRRYWLATNICARLGALMLRLLVRVGEFLIADGVVTAVALVAQTVLRVSVAVKAASVLISR